jgi:hypothetical protein
MEIINTEKFIKRNPTKLGSGLNDRGQWIQFYEHPTQGDTSTVIGMINGTTFYTGFFDLGDFQPGSDYLPVLLPSGKVINQWEDRR